MREEQQESAASSSAAARLDKGDLPPLIVTPPPGPRSRALGERLRSAEAPGINTVFRGRAAPAWAEALGSNVLDLDGNRFVDLTSGFGVATIGHRHPRIVAAVEAQARSLVHGLGDVHPHPLRAELAERLCSLVPVEDPRIHFGVSGAEAVEIALKTAILATGRPGVLAFEPAYHGLTLGALAATSREHFRRGFEPYLHPAVRRLAHGCEGTEIDRILGAENGEGGGIGCVIVEPVIGREGVIFPPPGWLSEVARACRRHRVLLICDEIFTGFGRTGKLFAVEEDSVKPDLLVCGKALGGGLPLAAVAGRRELMEGWLTSGEARHTATFVAHPLACASALATLGVLEEEDLVARGVRLGELISRRVETWPTRFDVLRRVRGRGALWGLELSSAGLASNLSAGLLARGILALSGGAAGNILQLVPALTIAETQLATALGALEEILEELSGHRRGAAE